MAEVVSEFVSQMPHPRLRPFIEQYTGYRNAGLPPGVHAGLPSRTLTFIIAFDDPLDVEHGTGVARVRNEFWAMLGGLHTTPALIRHPGRQCGVQIRVVPAGARALFGVSASALAHDVVPLDAVLPASTTELVDRLSEASTWSDRWAVLDEILLRVITDTDDAIPEIDSAWATLAATHGTIGIGELASSVGWNRRTLSGRFKQTFGMSPKSLARVMRFERAERLLRSSARPSLASVAHACGYADQAHMTREWVEFAGASPTVWLADETVPFVQDDDEVLPSSLQP